MPAAKSCVYGWPAALACMPAAKPCWTERRARWRRALSEAVHVGWPGMLGGVGLAARSDES